MEKKKNEYRNQHLAYARSENEKKWKKGRKKSSVTGKKYYNVILRLLKLRSDVETFKNNAAYLKVKFS